MQEDFEDFIGLVVSKFFGVEIDAEACGGPACESFAAGSFILLSVTGEKFVHADGDGEGGFLFVVADLHAFLEQPADSGFIQAFQFFRFQSQQEVVVGPGNE